MIVRISVIAGCGLLAGLLSATLAAGPEGTDSPSPQAVARIKPCGYPAGAHGDEVGTAVVHVWLDEHGKPTKTEIASTSGSPVLDAAALECARQSAWEPVQRQGRPAAYETDARFEWKGNTLPRTCDRPLRRNSLYTIKIRLTPAAVSQVKFEHQKPATALPAGVIGQSVICACVDEAGKIQDRVKLMQESGSSLLDQHALEIGATLQYSAGHPGCLRNAIDFAGPDG